MKPLDPRLLRRASAARGYVLLTAVTGVLTAALVVSQALLLAAVLAPAVSEARPLADARDLVAWLVGVVVLRAVVVHVQERFAHRAATRTIIDLRSQVVEAALARGPRWLAGGDGPATVTLATRGLDDLEPYFVRYLPQLLLAATLTPATLAVVWWQDWVAGAVVLGTIPLVPVFMILVGQLTQGVADRRLATMQRLGAQVLDLLAGLPTLRALGRENGPGARVRALGDAHRSATMGTLRVAFLSGMVLELLTTLSVAVVAVSVGLRLVEGRMDLQVGLAVIILAPEVFWPLRQVGMHFHASTDGLAAADAAFAIIEHPAAAPHAGTQDPFATGTFVGVRVDGLSVRAPGRDVLAPADLSADVGAGRVTALVGPNGAGKSTAVLALLGLVAPDAGRVLVRTRTPEGDLETDLAEIDLAAWHRRVAWVPQRTVLLPGTLLDAVRGTAGPAGAGPAGPSPAELEAARLTGLDAVVAALPDRWATRVGQGGVGLSLGQRQRVALTRALVGSRDVVILDEPTAHLDAASEEHVLGAVAALRAAGRTVVVVAHRPALVALADHVVTVASAPAAVPAPTDDDPTTTEVPR